MADDKKIDYSKVKTHGGVTTDEDGVAVPTALSDASRAARVQALKDEQSVLKGRADNGDDTAKRRVGEVDKQLDRLGERPQRTAKETAAPAHKTASPSTPPQQS